MESTFRLDTGSQQFRTPAAATRAHVSIYPPVSAAAGATTSGSGGTPAPRDQSANPDGPAGETPRSRKLRVTLNENDHLALMRAAVDTRDEYKEGNKMTFWENVRKVLKDATGKELSSPRHPIDRLVEDRRAYIEANGSAPLNKWPTDQLNSLIDQWIEFMDKYSEAEAAEKALKPPPRPELRIRHKGKTIGRKESPILPPGHNKRPRQELETSQPPRQSARLEFETPVPGPRPRAQSGHQVEDSQVVEDDQVVNLLDAFLDDQEDVTRSGGPAPKRPRHDARGAPQRVVVEGGMNKQDWMDVIGQVTGQVVGQTSAAVDPRISALETKVDSLIETTKRTHQLLVQLLRNQAKRGGSGAVNGDVQVNGESTAVSQAVPP